MLRFSYINFILIVAIVAGIGSQAMAANIIPPASSDAGRFEKEQKQQTPSKPPKYLPSAPEIATPGIKVPENAKRIHFNLKNINIEGATAFKPEELQPLYKEYINQEISLDTVWTIAASITKHYQDHGYFLSRAIVPEQEIGKVGTFKIKIIEGFIGTVEFDGVVNKNYIMSSLIEKLKAEKPVNIKKMESILLQLNDLPGASFRSIVEPLTNGEGAVKLILISQKKKGSGQISFDNYNSMYLGPYEATASYETSILPLNKTSLTILKSSPIRKLKYFNAEDDITILPGLFLGIYGGRTAAHPGYTLKQYDIESTSNNFGISITKQIIRQRLQNLALKFKIEGKNVNSDILNTVLTRDKIRSAIINLTYDGSDVLSGYNYLNVIFTKGITAFGASRAKAANLSRINVDPEFEKLEINANRFQSIGQSWTTVVSTAMQFSSGPLYSSDQFGYGGQSFGRAYDSSEISGDKGINGACELRYTGIPAWNKISFTPYGFYDVGKVWSVGEISHSRNSIGGGIRFESASGLAGNFTIANPLMHGVNTPRYANNKSPRYLFQLSYKF